jgi:hypothetical protein
MYYRTIKDYTHLKFSVRSVVDQRDDNQVVLNTLMGPKSY